MISCWVAKLEPAEWFLQVSPLTTLRVGNSWYRIVLTFVNSSMGIENGDRTWLREQD